MQIGLTPAPVPRGRGARFCSEAARRTGCRVIKAARVRSGADIQALSAFHTDFHLLDSYRKGVPGGTGETFAWDLARSHPRDVPVILSGGLTPDNVADAIARGAGPTRSMSPAASSRLAPGRKDHDKLRAFAEAVAGEPPTAVRIRMSVVEHRFGPYGGQYVPETLMPALAELELAWVAARDDPAFGEELDGLLRDYVGRPSPLYRARRLSEVAGHPIYLKREDLNHTGAHKINNALGQALLAMRMGKPRIIAETGAGQHGVATATACALLGLECVVYMGTEDMRRQKPNVERMGLLGARVEPVEDGARTLKEAVSAAIRDWVTNVETTHYIIGSCVGPAPYPAMVRDLQRIIGDEARAQILQAAGRLPDRVIACVGGGSNSIGVFVPFVADEDVRLIGVEAAGEGIESGRHGAPLTVAGTARRPAWRLLGDHAGRGRPDPRGPLDLGRTGLPRLRARARVAAR